MKLALFAASASGAIAALAIVIGAQQSLGQPRVAARPAVAAAGIGL